MRTILSLNGLLFLGLTLAAAQPVIVSQPHDQEVGEGETAVFAVVATGTEPISYQWRAYPNIITYTNIPGAIEPVLRLTNVQPTTHLFRVEVSNSEGSVVSRFAKLDVTPFGPPSIIVQPSNQISTIGGTATFQVEASGFPTPTVQWRHKAVDLIQETNTSLVLADLELNQIGSYDVVAANQVGSITSQVAMLNLVKTLHPPYDPGLVIETDGGEVQVRMTGEGQLEVAPAPDGPWQDGGIFVGSTNVTVSTGSSFYRVRNLHSRAVDVFIPSSFEQGTPLPLVIMLEGFVTTPQDAEDIWQVLPLAEERGFLYCYPSGNTNSEGYTSWNGTDTCCNSFGDRIDDVGFLSSLIKEAGKVLSADAKRTYLFGFSNGGAMALRMACEKSDLIAGVANYAGSNYVDPNQCRPTEPVNLLHLYGTADPFYLGGVNQWGITKLPAIETLQMWANYNGCEDPVTESAPSIDFMAYLNGLDTIVTRYTTAPPGGDVEYWEIQNGVHAPDPTPTISGQIIDWLLNRPKP